MSSFSASAEFLFDDVPAIVKELGAASMSISENEACTAAPSSSTATATRPTACSATTCISTSTTRGAGRPAHRCARAASPPRSSPRTCRRSTPDRGAAHSRIALIDLIHDEVQRRPDVLTFCTDSAGIRAAKRDGKIAHHDRRRRRPRHRGLARHPARFLRARRALHDAHAREHEQLVRLVGRRADATAASPISAATSSAR